MGVYGNAEVIKNENIELLLKNLKNYFWYKSFLLVL